MYGEKAASWQSDENGKMMIIITCLAALCASLYVAFSSQKHSLFTAALSVILTVIILFRLSTVIFG